MPAKKLGRLALLVMLCATICACGQPGRPRTVSDFCLLDRRISAEPAPVAGADDKGNQWDTEETFAAVLEHNAALERVCGK